MARRILNRKDLRAQAEAAERRQHEDESELEEEEDEEAEGADEEGAVDEEEVEEADEEESGEEAPPKRKAAKTTKAKPRSRSAKAVRMRVVWGVFNNSNQRVAVFDYPRRKEAEEHAAKLSADKKSTFFVQPVKEAIEEKKEA